MVIAPHVPSLCLFGCLCLFVLGLVPFWARKGVFFLLLFVVFAGVSEIESRWIRPPYKTGPISSTARNHNPQHAHPPRVHLLRGLDLPHGSVLGRSEHWAFPALRLAGRPHIYMAFVPIMHDRPSLCRIRVGPA